jgi:hypothetical protein
MPPRPPPSRARSGPWSTRWGCCPRAWPTGARRSGTSSACRRAACCRSLEGCRRVVPRADYPSGRCLLCVDGASFLGGHRPRSANQGSDSREGIPDGCTPSIDRADTMSPSPMEVRARLGSSTGSGSRSLTEAAWPTPRGHEQGLSGGDRSSRRRPRGGSRPCRPRPPRSPATRGIARPRRSGRR